MSRLKKLLASLGAASLLFLWTRHKYQINNDTHQAILNGTTVIKEPTPVEHQRHTNIYVPPEGSITITPRNPRQNLNDIVKVDIKWYGLTFHPGLRLEVLPLAVGLDSKVAFVGRLGLEVGMSTTITTLYGMRGVYPLVGLSYRLEGLVSIVQNTEITVGYRLISPTLLPLSIGIRANF